MSGSSSQGYQAILGDDLWTLVERVDSPLVGITSLTRLPSDRLHRASFRLRFADGRVLKGRRFDSEDEAARVWALSRLLDRRHFPDIVARQGKAVLVEWVEARAWDEMRPPLRLYEQLGEVLGALHCVRLPDAAATGRGVTLDSWQRRLRGNLAQLVRLNVLSDQEEELATELAMQVAPIQLETGVVHGDFCSENIVVTSGGRAWIVDNERLSIDAPAYDLARTWYRWPMDPDGQGAFLRGYSRQRSPNDFREHFSFWVIAVLSEAAVFRVSSATPDMNVPLERLREQLAARQGGLEGKLGPGTGGSRGVRSRGQR